MAKTIPEFFENSSFVTGDSPVTLDVNAVLGANATNGYVINDGNGSFKIEFSSDGTSFSNRGTMKKNEKIKFSDWNIDTIKITWVADTAYRVLVKI